MRSRRWTEGISRVRLRLPPEAFRQWQGPEPVGEHGSALLWTPINTLNTCSIRVGKRTRVAG